LTPKQPVPIKKATRPMTLGGEKYSLTPLLAMEIDRVPSEVKKVVEDQSLHQWIERSLEDADVLERFDKAVMDSRRQAVGTSYEHCLAGTVSIALDPLAPLRYRGMRPVGDAIGAAMV